MAATQVTNIIVPELFTPYTQQLTEEKSRLIQAGVLTANPVISEFLNGGGVTFNVPSFQDLDASDSTGADIVPTDTVADIQAFEAGEATAHPRADATPKLVSTSQEIGVRLQRNQSWSAMNLAVALAGADPMAAVGDRVSTYWARRLQRMLVTTFQGILADNELAPGDSEHVRYDLINDISAAFEDGVTNFSAEAFIDTAALMGDSMESLTAIMVHSVVYARMAKNNLIDFIPDARGEVNIPTFLGREVVVDDGLPASDGLYESWLFGAGAAQFGEGSDTVPTEVSREALAGNGGGQEILTSRRVYCIHPTGNAYVQGSIPDGGPSNSDLATAANWNRRYPERKQIKFAVLRTREAAAA